MVDSTLYVIFAAFAATLCAGQTSITPEFPALPPRNFLAELEATSTFNGMTRTEAFREYFEASTKTVRIQFSTAASEEEILLINQTSGRVFLASSSNCTEISSAEVRRSTAGLIMLNSFIDGDNEQLNTSLATYQGRGFVRGITVDRWSLSNYVIDRANFTSTWQVEWLFSIAGWREDGIVVQQLVGVRLTGIVTSRDGHVFDVSSDINIFDVYPLAEKDMFLFNHSFLCEQRTPPPQPPDSTGSTNKDQPFPFPPLPREFTAVIETNMRELQNSFTVRELFSGISLTSKTSVIVDGKTSAATLIIGTFQLAFLITFDGTAKAYSDTWSLDPSAIAPPRCTKNIFNSKIIGSVDDLLFVKGTPKYMGRTSVRNIPAQTWRLNTQDYQIDWYFNDSTSHLLRIVVEGTGKSPFFPHHPFFHRGDPVSPVMEPACGLFPISDRTQCSSGEPVFHHIHEFIQFEPFVDASEFIPPAECDMFARINSVPFSDNCPMPPSSFSIFLLCLLVGLLSAALSSIVTCRYLRKDARIREEQ